MVESPSGSQSRTTAANAGQVAPGGAFVLYWMTSFRRTHWNHSLDRAVSWAQQLSSPLLVFEALRSDYPWASDRIHRFILQGMVDNDAALRRTRVMYYPYLEDSPGAGKGLLSALAQHACVIVTDDYPAFFIPKMVAKAAAQVPVLMEKVDSSGLIPLRLPAKTFTSAHHFRRFLHRHLADCLYDLPNPRPLQGKHLPQCGPLPSEIQGRWPRADLQTLLEDSDGISRIPLDHSVPPVVLPGGSAAARRILRNFINEQLPRYAELRSHPEAGATSGLSPHLHFGHISAYEVVQTLLDHQGWLPDRIETAAAGQRRGWWGVDENAESFLDELVTWRELGFNTCVQSPDFESYRSLPEWARSTLDAHRHDIRTYLYTPNQFERAETHDPLWNAAQHQLTLDGTIHGYLRMLWGKKILEWSPDPETAHTIMIELNNKYALDGRDPNSYSGISWVLGKYDRPWAPERPIFGRVRYMSSQNTARKFKISKYLERYG
jgi:deoxyribodipyrimidine photo-lyase